MTSVPCWKRIAGLNCRRLTQAAFAALILCVLFVQKPSLIPLSAYHQLVEQSQDWDGAPAVDASKLSLAIPVTSTYKPLEVDILAEFPRKIVQTTTTSGKRDFEHMWKSWRDLNPDHTYWIMKGRFHEIRETLRLLTCTVQTTSLTILLINIFQCDQLSKDSGRN